MKIFLEKVSRGKTLSENEAEAAMECIFADESSVEMIAAFLAIIHTRGESLEELTGFVRYLKKQIRKVDNNFTLIDTCGTGGDYANTFNVSTASALLLASSGIKVAKHGGGKVSSLSGSADVLRALEIGLPQETDLVKKYLNELGFVFLFVPYFNPVWEKVRSLRKLLGIRTCFNFLGPLLNPCGVKKQIVGVYHARLLVPMAKLFQQFDAEEVMVVHGMDGLDEISIDEKTQVAHLKNGEIICYEIDPFALGFKTSKESIQGGGATENAAIIQQIFSGGQGRKREMLTLNAAAGFMISGVVTSLKDGVHYANEILDSGQAHHFLKRAVNFSKEITLEDSFLVRIKKIVEERVQSKKIFFQTMTESSRSPLPFFKNELVDDSISFIAEIKFASPVNTFNNSLDPLQVAKFYLENGAYALSVLTEPEYFLGSIDYLKKIRQAFPQAKILMKDFILDESQLIEALVSGADAVLLIVAFLSISQLKKLYEKSIALKLTPLVEVHTLEELKIAENLGAQVIGVNNRNLHNLIVDTNVAEKIISQATTTATFIAMSGIKNGKMVKALNKKGYRGVLIGSHLMSSQQPGKKLKQLIDETYAN